MVINCEKNFDIKKLTSFKIGGRINEVFLPENIDEFSQILDENPDIKVFGNLSNTLIYLFLFKPGLEFMIGFPGSVGGEVYMNASANSQAISDRLNYAICYSKNEGIMKLYNKEMEFQYRSSRCQKENLVVLQACFELEYSDRFAIQKRMNENLNFRKVHQPSLVLPNCGSIFKNPAGDSAGRLLDSVGAKNMISGGVRVWENHANFIVNDRAGSSLDVLNLMFEMYSKVKENYGIELEPEIRFLGGNNKKENEF